jgi:N-formylglutamate deformylase
VSDVWSFHQGTAPLLISVPHDGRLLPQNIQSRMSAAGLALPDTDWHVARLYELGKQLGASMLVANFSRFVVDLNRPADDEAMYAGQTSTGLCPTMTFQGDSIYVDEEMLDAAEKQERVKGYWRPYHDKIAATLQALRAEHGYGLLWDAHSIPSQVPRLFSGELPVLSIGTWDSRSCDPALADAVFSAAERSGYDSVINARFKGGYITRHYGQPADNVHAVQLEIAQRAYMDESSLDVDEVRMSQLSDSLEALLVAYISAAAKAWK